MLKNQENAVTTTSQSGVTGATKALYNTEKKNDIFDMAENLTAEKHSFTMDNEYYVFSENYKDRENNMIEKNQSEDIFEVAKHAENIVDVMRQYYPRHTLTQQAKNQYRTKSIYDPDTNNTCTVIFTDTNSFHDYKVNKTGDIIDLIAHATNNSSRLEVARFLVGNSGYTSENISKLQKYQKAIEKKYLAFHENLKNYPDVVRYLHDRRINDETIEKYKIGVAVDKKTEEIRISIPYFNEQGNIIYGVTRRFSNTETAKYKKEFIPDDLKQAGFLQPLMFLDTLRKKDKSVLFIGEGVFDVLSAVQEGYSGLSFGGGNPGSENIEKYCNYAKQFDKIVLCFDNDNDAKKDINAGENFTIETAQNLLNAGISNFYCIRDYGEKCKDLSDFYTASGDVSFLISRAKKGVTFAVEKLTEKLPITGDVSTVKKGQNKKELKDLWVLLQKTLSDDEVLLKECKSIFEKRYSKTVIKKFSKEKNRDEIINAVVDDFLDVNIVQATGSPKRKEFFIYDKKRGIIKRVNEGYIYADLKEKYNINENIYVKATNEIYAKTLIRKHEDMPMFNMREAFNFKTRVYDITQQKLLDHSPNYKFNVYANFDYDPNADCPLFKKFLHTFCNGNQSRLNTIKDMLGYLLAPHCKGQAVFCLIGSGANGKGVFETVIKGIFDALEQDFVTDINPDDMNDPNQKIRLSHSIVNFNSDCSRYVSKVACANIKRASGGDTISGNKKFYDITSFKTRAKHIFGFNEMPVFYDTTLGMKRRLVFVKLENSFLKNPDIHLPEKLLSEKEGIFNFMLECYYALKARNFQIRRCDDQSELMNRFVVESNIIAQFIDENANDFKASIFNCEKKAVYDAFKEYFKNSGEHSKRPSFRAFNDEIKKLYPDIETWKSNGKTYWNFERVTFSSSSETETEAKTESQSISVDESVEVTPPVEAVEVEPVEVVEDVQPISEKEKGEISWFISRIQVNAKNNDTKEHGNKLQKLVASLRSITKIKEAVERLKNEATVENEKNFYIACLTDVEKSIKKIA